jgi:hypothetical protein
MSTSNTVALAPASTMLHRNYVEAVRQVRERLGAANIGNFFFSITAHGRTETGADDVEILYTINDGRYGNAEVTGDTVDAVCEEFLRRKGWKSRHAPLRLA